MNYSINLGRFAGIYAIAFIFLGFISYRHGILGFITVWLLAIPVIIATADAAIVFKKRYQTIPPRKHFAKPVFQMVLIKLAISIILGTMLFFVLIDARSATEITLTYLAFLVMGAAGALTYGAILWVLQFFLFLFLLRGLPHPAEAK